MSARIAPSFELRGPFGPGRDPVGVPRQQERRARVLPAGCSRPVCSAQLPTIQDQYAKFESSSAVVLGISVDSYHANEAFAKQLGLSFPLLSDFNRADVRSLWRAERPEHGTSGRAVFVIDNAGQIAYRDVSPTPRRSADIPSRWRARRAARARCSSGRSAERGLSVDARTRPYPCTSRSRWSLVVDRESDGDARADRATCDRTRLEVVVGAATARAHSTCSTATPVDCLVTELRIHADRRHVACCGARASATPRSARS